jgi:Dolichyl-phosphate-mannose-protein mannosyltransferase
MTESLMFYVPLYIEGLRSRPQLVFWLATLAQAALWLIVPMLFYAAPPGELAQLLAIAHEPALRASVGPPLAYWLAEAAFRAGGLFGVYLLSQLCVVATFWCVFALGRAMIGATHAVMATLLMVGIFAFTVPTPNFGPPILAMALWAAALLFYWRAVAQGRRQYWYAFAGAAGCLLISSEIALIPLGVLVLFTALTERGRAAADTFEAWIATAAVLGMVFVYFVLLKRAGVAPTPAIDRLRVAGIAGANAVAWLGLLGLLIIAHAGLILLVALAFGWPRTGVAPAPAISRVPVAPFAVTFVKTFAIVPVLLATIAAVLAGLSPRIDAAAPLLVLSGLAVVVIAGNSIELHHQRVLGLAWLGLLLAPAIFVPIVIALLPWTTGTELKVAQPANAMGRFFADSFARRTGRPLAIVGGDAHIAELVALGAPNRPSVYFDAASDRAPSIGAETIRDEGAVIVWPAAGTDPEPPPQIRARFPALVPEVPHTFERAVRGRLPPLLVGWGVIRPANGPAASPAPGAAAPQ